MVRKNVVHAVAHICMKLVDNRGHKKIVVAIYPSIHSKSRQLIPLKEKNVSFPGGWAGSFVSKDASFPIPVSLDCFFFYSFFKMFWFIVCVGYGGTTTNLRA